MKKTFVLLVLSVLLYSCEGYINPRNFTIDVKRLPIGEVELKIDNFDVDNAFVVDWGDGQESIPTTNTERHIYDKNGSYLISVKNSSRIGDKDVSQQDLVSIDDCSGSVVFYGNSKDAHSRIIYLNGKNIGALTKYLVNVSTVPDCSWSNSDAVIVVKGLKLNTKYTVDVWPEGSGSSKIFPSITLTKNRQCLPYLNNY